MIHLLKCHYQPQRKGRSWIATLAAQRAGIMRILRSSPSLRRLIGESMLTEYPAAVRQVHAQTGQPKSDFPAQLPFTVEQILDDDFIP